MRTVQRNFFNHKCTYRTKKLFVAHYCILNTLLCSLRTFYCGTAIFCVSLLYKAAKLMNLGYPGGPAISKEATKFKERYSENTNILLNTYIHE